MSSQVNQLLTKRDTDMFKQTLKALVLMPFCILWIASSYAGGSSTVVSRPDHSRGTYEEVVKDMQVKVLGGHVTLKRKYTKDGWQFNSNWRNLEFKDPAGTAILFAGGSTPSNGGEIIVQNGDPEPVIRTVLRGRFEYTPMASNKPNRYVDEVHPGQVIVKEVSGYRWADREGNWIEYNTYGEALRYGNKNNVTVSFVRDTAGRIVQVNDHLNSPILNYDYSVAGVVTVSDYSGRSVKYHGSDLQFMNKVTDVRGNDWHYEYTTLLNRPYLSKKIDPELREIAIGHQVADGGPQVVNAGDGSPIWQIEEYTDPDTGEVLVREKVVDSSSSLNQSVTTMVPSAVMYTHMTYNTDGGKTDYRYYYNSQTKTYSLVEKTSDGLYTDRWFALDGKLKRVAVGGNILFTRAEAHDGSLAIKTDTKGRKTTFHYNQWEKLTSIIYPDDSAVAYQYHPQYAFVTEYVDENGHKTTFDYDAQLNLVKQTTAAGTANQRITEFGHDAYGQVTLVRRLGDANTATAETIISYDNYGNITQVTDPEGHLTKYQLHNAQGQPTKMIDGRGKVWLFNYDNAGNLTQQDTPLGFVTKLVYDKVDNLISVTDPELNLSQFGYDARDRLINTVNPLGDNSSIAYTLDGRPKLRINEQGHKEYFEYDLQRRLKAVTNDEGLRHEFNYQDEQTTALARLDNIITPNGKIKLLLDKKGRLIQRSNASIDGSLSFATNIDYDKANNVTKQIDANSHATNYLYNEHDQPVSESNALIQTTEFSYDSQGNLIKVKDANNSETTYQYDRRGLRIAEIKPLGQQMQYQYDETGILIQRVDSKNQLIKYAYDDDGRLSQEQHFDTVSASTAAKTISYSYNKNNIITGYTDGVTSASYQPDKLSRLASSTVNYGPFSKTFTYSYAKDGKVSSFTNGESVISSYQYDKANRLQLIQIAGQGSITFTQYQGYQPGTILYPGGVKVSHSYDGIGRLTQQEVKDPAANSLQNSQYSYDSVGNVTAKSINNDNYGYDYDSAYRLTLANQPSPLVNRNYQYDGVGNRTSSDVTSNWNYNANHQLLSYGEAGNITTLSYDDNGSTITKTNGSNSEIYLYDIANRLIEVKLNGATIARYYYDPFGRRLSKEVGGVTTYFLYANEGLIGEYTSTGTLISSYMYLPDSMWGTKPLGRVTAGEAYFYQHDQLGTPNLLTSKTGQVKWQGAVDAFGQVQNTINGLTNKLRFPGQYYDQESGLYYNYFRDYDPELGRYTQSDPIGLAGGINTYGYAYQNPVMYTDPRGLIIPQVAGGVGGFTFGLLSAIGQGQTGWCAIRSGLYAGVAGAVSGGGSVVTAMLVSSAISVAEQAGRNGFDKVSYLEAGANGLTAGLGGKLGGLLGKWRHPVKNYYPNRSKWNPKYWGEKLGWNDPLPPIDLSQYDRDVFVGGLGGLIEHGANIVRPSAGGDGCGCN